MTENMLIVVFALVGAVVLLVFAAVHWPVNWGIGKRTWKWSDRRCAAALDAKPRPEPRKLEVRAPATRPEPATLGDYLNLPVVRVTDLARKRLLAISPCDTLRIMEQGGRLYVGLGMRGAADAILSCVSMDFTITCAREDVAKLPARMVVDSEVFRGPGGLAPGAFTVAADLQPADEKERF